MKEQTATLRDVKADVEDLIVPVKIELERFSGSIDTDNKPGDDALLLYVQPVDRDGSIIKAAGSIKVTLFDLANPPTKTCSPNTISTSSIRGPCGMDDS